MVQLPFWCDIHERFGCSFQKRNTRMLKHARDNGHHYYKELLWYRNNHIFCWMGNIVSGNKCRFLVFLAQSTHHSVHDNKLCNTDIPCRFAIYIQTQAYQMRNKKASENGDFCYRMCCIEYASIIPTLQQLCRSICVLLLVFWLLNTAYQINSCVVDNDNNQ